MNDRFKFRVFISDKKNSKNSLTGMFKVHSLHTGTNKAIITSLYGNCSIKLENNILMQSTGLKDKNGKLIYEGDIVDKGTRCKWIITWFKNRFILVPDFEYKNKDKCVNDRECGFKYFENNHSYADKDAEVIGNIYENKFLLESEG